MQNARSLGHTAPALRGGALSRIAILGAALALCNCGDDDAAVAAAGKDAGSTMPSGGKGPALPSDAGAGGAGMMTAGRHSISGSVTASVATGVAMTLSGDYDAVTVPDAKGVYHFDNLADGDYVVTPSLFGYTFQPPSRAVTLTGANVIAKDFAAIAGNPACMTGFELGAISAMGRAFTDVVSGDFNADGDLDLIAVDGTIAVFLGHGDGTLAAPVSYAAGDGARYVTAADLDGDGKLDLVAIGIHANLAALLGRGDGTFEDPIEHMVTTSGDGSKAALGDFDGDGNVDVAVSVTAKSAVAVLLGGGDGAFGDPVEYASGDTGRWVVTADLDGDGELDLASAQAGPDGASVLIGHGDGSFEPGVLYPLGKFPYSLLAADFNADHKLDLASCNNNGTNVSVLIGAGDGTFGTAVDYRADGMPFSITSGDFNGDGKLDLVSANGAVQGVGMFLGAGDGTFGTMIATHAPASGVTAGDFDGDGKLDLGVAGGGGAAILRNCR